MCGVQCSLASKIFRENVISLVTSKFGRNQISTKQMLNICKRNARVFHESHEHWSPKNYDDSQVFTVLCSLLFTCSLVSVIRKFFQAIRSLSVWCSLSPSLC